MPRDKLFKTIIAHDFRVHDLSIVKSRITQRRMIGPQETSRAAPNEILVSITEVYRTLFDMFGFIGDFRQFRQSCHVLLAALARIHSETIQEIGGYWIVVFFFWFCLAETTLFGNGLFYFQIYQRNKNTKTITLTVEKGPSAVTLYVSVFICLEQLYRVIPNPRKCDELVF